jgi:hypothetical protein
MTTAIDFINRALRSTGILASGESADAAMAADAFVTLNDMLDSWSVANIFLYCMVDVPLSATLNQGQYTIGPGGNFNTVRPTTIQSMTYQVGEISYDVTPLTRDQFSSIGVKSNGGIPAWFNYEPTFPLGVISIYPVPATAGTLLAQLPQQFTQFATLTTNINFPPGYNEAIHLGLAVMLCNEFKIELTPLLKASEQRAFKRIKRANVQIPTLSIPGELITYESLPYGYF